MSVPMGFFSIKLITFIAIFIFSQSLFANLACLELFSRTTNVTTLTFDQQMERLEQALLNLHPDRFKATPEEFKNFNRSESSYKALEVFHRRNHVSIRQFWMFAARSAFVNLNLETKENVNRFHKLYERYERAFQKLPDIELLMNQSRKEKYERASKLTIIQFLKMQSHWLSIFFDNTFNFLLQDDLFVLFEANSRNQFISNLSKYEAEFDELVKRAGPLVEDYSVSSGGVMADLNSYFFGNSKAPGFSAQDRGFFQRNATYEEILSLLLALRLPEKRFSFYLEQLNLIKKDHGSMSEAVILAHRFFALLLLQATEEAFGARVPSGTQWFRNNSFNTNTYLVIKNRIESMELLRAIIEEKMSSYVNLSDALNARVYSVHELLDQLVRTAPETQDQVDHLQTQLRALEIKDFGEDLSQREENLFEIESQLDTLKEVVANRKKNEAIKYFYELNNRWHRLIPDKTYEISGIDYHGVLFTSDVIQFFSKNPVLGSRYLAAFSKSYVAVLGETGLRRLPSIHSEMRDIKIIRSHGKIRIVGRLIDGVIHFFYIYDSEKPYENQRLHQIVENYSPHSKKTTQPRRDF